MMTVLYVFLTSDFQRLSVLLLLAYLQSDKKIKTLINKNVSVYLLKGFLCCIFVPEMRFPLYVNKPNSSCSALTILYLL